MFCNNAMHTDIMRCLGHAWHYLYAKCQTIPVRCRRQLLEKTIIIPFAEAQTSSTRIKSKPRDSNTTNLLGVDNALGPARLQNAKTAAPKLRRSLAERYRYELLPPDHWHGNTLLCLTCLCNNLHRLDFMRESHVYHNSRAGAESW